MNRVLIFGTGKFYQKRKEYVLNNEVIGFLDNDCNKQHQYVDGKYVYAPSEVMELQFNYILIMSASYASMRKQLCNMGIEDSKIIDYEYYYKIKPYTEIKLFCSYVPENAIDCEKLFLLVSHELSNTGAPIVLYYMAKLLQKNGYCPVIVSRKEGTLQKSILSDRIPLIICEELNFNNFLFNVLLKKAQLILFNTIEVGYLIEDCLHYNKKIVWWLHEGEASYHDKTIVNCNRYFTKNVEIYAVSELSEKCFHKFSDRNCVKEVLPYGIPDRGYKEKKMGNKIRFLLAGTISKRKGQDVMMEAIELLTDDEIQKTEFIFAGCISEKGIYRKIQNCTLSQVTYKGVLDIDEMQELYEDIDVVVCPSREDPLPVVLTEGMMNKRLCIMSDNTGTASMIKDRQEGLICKTGDVQSLVDQIRWVIYNVEKMNILAEAGRRVYERVFSMEAYERRILQIINE